MHVRECALGAILCFLRSQSSDPSSNLITLDVARRIAACLSNALAFANGFLSVAHVVEDPMLALPEPGTGAQNAPRKTGLSLRDREALLRSRVFECFSLLTLSVNSAVSGPSSTQSTGVAALSEGTQDALLRSTIALFASQEGYGGSTVQAAIVSSTGNFGSIWTPSGNSDGYAYGMGWRVVEEVWDANGGDKQDTGVESVIDSYVSVSYLFTQKVFNLLTDAKASSRSMRTGPSLCLFAKSTSGCVKQVHCVLNIAV